MFILVNVRDTVRIAPTDLLAAAVPSAEPQPTNGHAAGSKTLTAHPYYSRIIDSLSAKCCNHILPDAGLALAIYKLQKIGDLRLLPGDGAIHVTVEASVLSFAPQVGEVFIGRLQQSDSNGIIVSLTFFDNVFIPASALPQPCRFDAAEGVWVWAYEGNDLYMDAEHPIRCRITDVIYNKRQRPSIEGTGEQKPVSTAIADADDADVDALTRLSRHHASWKQPMLVLASAADGGFGMLEWWT